MLKRLEENTMEYLSKKISTRLLIIFQNVNNNYVIF